MKKRLLLISGLLLAAFVAFKAPQYLESNKAYATMNTQTPGKIEQYTIKVGEAPQALLDRYPGYISGSAQPAGLAFYSSDPDKRNTFATIHVELNKYSFDIQNSTGFMGTYDAGLPNEGIADYVIYFDFTTAESSTPEAARQGVLAFLKSLREKGWKTDLGLGNSRLIGKAGIESYLADNKYRVNALDPDYEILPEDWVKLGTTETSLWRLYADNVFLTLGFQSEADKKHPGMVSYLFTISLTTAENYYRGTVDPKDRIKWRQMWPETERTLMNLRRDAEIKAAQDCLELDLDYTDPPLPPDFSYTSPYKTGGIDKDTYTKLRQHCGKARPHAEAEPASIEPPARLALGTTQPSDSLCPQSGLWRCNTETQAGERERWFTAGQVLPPILVAQTKDSITGRLFRQTQNVLATTQWTLIAYPDETA